MRFRVRVYSQIYTLSKDIPCEVLIPFQYLTRYVRVPNVCETRTSCQIRDRDLSGISITDTTSQYQILSGQSSQFWKDAL
jgi:hypothetical protein